MSSSYKVSSSYKGTNPIKGPTLMTSSQPNDLLKALSPNTITWEVRALPYEFRVDRNIGSITHSDTVFKISYLVEDMCSRGDAVYQ